MRSKPGFYLSVVDLGSQSPLLKRATDQFSDVRWRLNNLYFIEDKDGKRVPFRMNTAQERLFDEMHVLNIVLKARQMGFSTLIDLYILDQCMFNSHTAAGIIAHRLEDATKIFASKIKFPYDNYPEQLKAANPPTGDSKTELTLKNHSTISVGTSHRSGTLQILHVSEYGKICAQFPEKALEIKTGALNTVAPGQMAFIESTAEGKEGDFYERVKVARALEDSGSVLTSMDWKFHFFPWFEDETYRIPAEDVLLTVEDRAYFDKLAGQGIKLSPEQKAWYAKKAIDQGDEMSREYPSTPDEAFEAAIEGAYFSKQMSRARRESRIGLVPLSQRLPVDTFWDIGINDTTNIWLHQHENGANRFVGYYYNEGEGLAHYINWLRQWGTDREIVWGKHYGPHDIENREFGPGTTRREQAAKLGFKFEVVPRVTMKANAIEAARAILSTCYFDLAACAKGIAHLDGYRKSWNETLAVWRDEPRHDDNSHGADAFMTFAMGFKAPPPPKFVDRYKREHRAGSPSFMGV